MAIHIQRELTHVQEVASDEWNIVHGFGRPVVVDVYLQLPGWDAPRKVIPADVKIVNVNTIKILFGPMVVAGTAIIR